MKTYFTLDNGGLPFKVVVDKKNRYLSVYNYLVKTSLTKNWSAQDYETKPSYSTKYLELFIGRQTDLEIQKGRDVQEGSSLLAEIEPLHYVFIGEDIFTFHTQHRIVEYVGYVGNSDVVYPWAVDSAGNIILLLERVWTEYEDPYQQFYFTTSKGENPPRHEKHYFSLKYKQILPRILETKLTKKSQKFSPRTAGKTPTPFWEKSNLPHLTNSSPPRPLPITMRRTVPNLAPKMKQSPRKQAFQPKSPEKVKYSPRYFKPKKA